MCRARFAPGLPARRATIGAVPDTRPFLMPVSVVLGAVQHSGTYEVKGDALTVRYGSEAMTVELGEANAGKRAVDVLAALVKRSRRAK
jgi:hypothetical protein